ncbi:helix-turn-helix domain-containing protein [Pontibacter sp. 13R65]|uniref:helix-turn-helix domain-containing protein n=1 Tax=Pontibacter sp. 13R65 TaxID=3127458 RepID=UPI00301E3AEF
MTEQIRNYGFKEGMPVEFEIVSITDLYKKNKDILTSPHRTAFYHILWFQKGTPSHLVDFNPVEIKPQTLLFLNKDTVQLFDPKESFEAKGILFTDNFFFRTEADMKFLRSSILFNDLLGVSQVQLDSSIDNFKILFRLMEAELANKHEIYYADTLRSLLHSFLLLAERERRKQDFTELKKGPDLDYTILFRDLVEADFRQLKQVNGYASKLSVTEKRLNQATTVILGKSPKSIIDERVMLEAKRLLAHTNDSIKEIGYSLGFQEPTNFIKFFRKHNRSTPVEFREQFAT